MSRPAPRPAPPRAPVRFRLGRFLRDERGSVVVEGLIMLPALLWGYLGLWAFFDGWHAKSVNLKATEAMADILSRERNPVTPEYLDSLHALQDALTDASDPRRLRVSVAEWREAEDRWALVWSQARGGAEPLTPALLPGLVPALPAMAADAEVVIAVESWVGHRPVYAALDPLTFHDIVVVSPRWVETSFCWSRVNDNPGMGDVTC